MVLMGSVFADSHYFNNWHGNQYGNYYGYYGPSRNFGHQTFQVFWKQEKGGFYAINNSIFLI